MQGLCLRNAVRYNLENMSNKCMVENTCTNCGKEGEIKKYPFKERGTEYKIKNGFCTK